MKQPKILIFAHDGRGLGHLRRLARLGKALQGTAAVLFVAGHREASWLIPPECEFVHIPSLDSTDKRRSRQWGRKPFCLAGAGFGRNLRRAIVKACVDEFRPDALIVDYLPLGMFDELEEICNV
jgi:predicted glycosyltransferase